MIILPNNFKSQYISKLKNFLLIPVFLVVAFALVLFLEPGSHPLSEKPVSDFVIKEEAKTIRSERFNVDLVEYVKIDGVTYYINNNNRKYVYFENTRERVSANSQLVYYFFLSLSLLAASAIAFLPFDDDFSEFKKLKFSDNHNKYRRNLFYKQIKVWILCNLVFSVLLSVFLTKLNAQQILDNSIFYTLYLPLLASFILFSRTYASLDTLSFDLKEKNKLLEEDKKEIKSEEVKEDTQ